MNDFAPGLGDSQRTLLALLKRRGPTTIVDLETVSGLSRETLREHLRSLGREGLVERAGLLRAGRGRPALVYRLTERGERLFPQRQGELLGELATFLLADGGDALDRFFSARAATRRPRLLARVEGLTGAERVREVAAILDEEGYVAEVEPGPDGGPRLRLCHCPLRELVAVSHAACRAEISLVEDLLGAAARREAFIPDGAPSCTYSFASPSPAAGVSRRAAHPETEKPR